MFAFCIWDLKLRKMYLVRDRFGEKPLYYSSLSNMIVFASELKALREFEELELEIDRDSLSLFFKNNYIPAPYSVYKGVFKVAPATIMCFCANEFKWTTEKYWHLDKPDDINKDLSDIETIDFLCQKLESAVEDQLIADVPVGAFLSGGIDSSLIVSMMSAVSPNPVNTFSIGFHDQEYNEATEAEATAKFLEANHKTLIATPESLIEAAENIAKIYDEPFADYSQIPTYLVSKFAKESVSVVLTGDGGDELFGGYTRHVIFSRYSWIYKVPFIIRWLTGRLILSIPHRWMDRLAHLLIRKGKARNIGSSVEKFARFISAKTIFEAYTKVTGSWQDDGEIVLGASGSSCFDHKKRLLSCGTGINAKDIMRWDIESYLADGILVKLDRATMSVSLEGRVPFLNHTVVNFAWGIPHRFNISGNLGKKILRRSLRKYLPEELINRPKNGFSLPMCNWLRGPLKGWASELLSKDRICQEGYLNWDLVDKKWSEHQLGIHDWSQDLWCVLIFQIWILEFKSSSQKSHS